jgi:hypothetical protein
MVRSIARTAAVLLVAAQIDHFHPGRAIADYEIADILEADKRTVIKQLRSLSAAGLVLEQQDGRYVVTPNGRHTLFGWSDGQLLQPTNLSIEETKIYDDAQNVHAQNVLHDDDDINSDSDSESSSSVTERTKCARMLEATHLLFTGGAVNPITDKELNPQWVLAWIAKAYTDRRKLTNAQGLVWSRLQRDVRPPLQYLKNPEDYLPREYLVEIGLEEQSVEETETTPVMDDNEYDGVGRHRVWLEVLCDPNCPNVRGVAFKGDEQVNCDGPVMTVAVRETLLQPIAEHNLAEALSKIYAMLSGIDHARVVFVAVETEAERG